MPSHIHEKKLTTNRKIPLQTFEQICGHFRIAYLSMAVFRKRKIDSLLID